MSTRAKLNSSWASNRMTRANGPSQPLLSTFQGKQPDVNAEPAQVMSVQQEDTIPSSPLSSVKDIELSDAPDEPLDQETVLPTTEVETRLEPGTDDEPISSEEELSDSDASPPRKEVNYVTLEQRLAEAENSQASPGNRGTSRTLNDMMGDSDGDEIISSWGSSQSKRAKLHTYQKNPYSNRSSFAKPVDKPKTQTRKVPPIEKKLVEAPKEPKATFIVPKDIGSPFFNDGETGELVPSWTPQFRGKDTPNDSGADSPLPSTSSSYFKDMKVQREASPSDKAQCPMCKSEIEPEILALFQSQPKQRIREQQLFCESHKTRSAGQQWEKRGYPSIAWEQFDTRIQSLFPDIEKLLVPDVSSYYRNILDGVLASGQAKNFRLTLDGKGLETITCGYYGLKGASKMLDAVVARFSRSLRRLATTDRIVKTAGVAGYAQCVLVPELAMRLVKQDMDVDDETARQIMRDSMEIGQRLNPEVNDVVPVSNDPKDGLVSVEEEDEGHEGDEDGETDEHTEA